MRERMEFSLNGSKDSMNISYEVNGLLTILCITLTIILQIGIPTVSTQQNEQASGRDALLRVQAVKYVHALTQSYHNQRFDNVDVQKHVPTKLTVVLKQGKVGVKP